VRAEKLEEAKVSKVIFDTSASPDGFAIASGVRLEEPMSDGGEELHGWGTSIGSACRTHSRALSCRLRNETPVEAGRSEL